jgi:hypothetical protein
MDTKTRSRVKVAPPMLIGATRTTSGGLQMAPSPTSPDMAGSAGAHLVQASTTPVSSASGRLPPRAASAALPGLIESPGATPSPEPSSVRAVPMLLRGPQAARERTEAAAAALASSEARAGAASVPPRAPTGSPLRPASETPSGRTTGVSGRTTGVSGRTTGASGRTTGTSYRTFTSTPGSSAWEESEASTSSSDDGGGPGGGAPDAISPDMEGWSGALFSRAAPAVRQATVASSGGVRAAGLPQEDEATCISVEIMQVAAPPLPTVLPTIQPSVASSPSVETMQVAAPVFGLRLVWFGLRLTAPTPARSPRRGARPRAARRRRLR